MTEKCTDIEFDLETLSLEPNAAITEIGAVAYNLGDGIPVQYPFHTKHHLSSIPASRRIDGLTLAWRLGERHSAQLVDSNVDYREGLTTFFDWVHATLAPGGRVWSRGHMDYVWLESALLDLKLQLPFEFRQWRDSRTYTDMQLHPGTRVVEPKRNGPAHNALWDAEYQARWVHAVYWAAR